MPVYLIRAGLAGDVKIGSTANPLNRLRGLQTSHPQKLRLIRLLDGGRKEEAGLHEKFAKHRKEGEWFAFCDEMAAPDLGLPDLPIPFPKRKRPEPDTPYAKRNAFHEDVFLALGREDAIGRRLGVAPWEACEWHSIKSKYYSAVALLMRDAGYKHVTVDIFLELDQLVDEAFKEATRRNAIAERKRITTQREAIWVEKHGRDAAWWPLTEPETAPATPAVAA